MGALRGISDPDAAAGSGMASEKSFDPDGAGMTRQGCVHTMFLLRLCSAHRLDARHDRTRIWLADGMPAHALCHSAGSHILSQACPMHDMYDVNVSAVSVYRRALQREEFRPRQRRVCGRCLAVGKELRPGYSRFSQE